MNLKKLLSLQEYKDYHNQLLIFLHYFHLPADVDPQSQYSIDHKQHDVDEGRLKLESGEAVHPAPETG